MNCAAMRDDPGGGGCRVSLRNSLAIVMRKEGCQGDPGEFWMYESGYLLFQGLLSANSVCWWNNALNGATKNLIYRGYVSPGALLVDSEPCALEIVRGAWARRVLQAPAGYQIVAVEDVEDCAVKSVAQTQWTPLPEAVCAVVLRLSSQGRPAGIETIREALIMAFPHVSPPSERVLYDTLTQLTSERKLYHTTSGYFIVTPERRRSRSHSSARKKPEDTPTSGRSMLMSTEEALIRVHGEMTTIRDGDVTHQCIQTNLADVICGGNASDKILFARSNKRRSASFPAPRSPDGRGTFRFWGSRRLRRSASTRTLARNYADSSSSTEYPSSNGNQTFAKDNKRESLLSRLFRRSKRSHGQISTFSAQFPPTEWFNSKAVHLHNVATQTSLTDKDSALSLPYYCDNSEMSSSRSATLPRRHRRQLSNDSAYIEYHPHHHHGSSSNGHEQNSPISRYNSNNTNSNTNSPLHSSSTLPRNGLSSRRSPLHRSGESSRKTSRSSLGGHKSSASASEIQANNKADSKATASSRGELSRVEEKKASGDPLATKTTSQNDGGQQPQPVDNNEEDGGCFDHPAKSFASLDNSGPSSIESHKSSKTGSSLTSGPSSLESHKTVINRSADVDSGISVKSSPKRKPKSGGASGKAAAKPAVSQSNSFTLQVTTNQVNPNNNTTATINSANTKIYVQNSPVRSVITFENGQNNAANPNVVIINDSEPAKQPYVQKESNEIKVPAKNTNQENNQTTMNVGLNNSRDFLTATEGGEDKNKAMNNSRKLSLQLPKEGLSYRNLLKNVPHRNQFASNSNPDSPLANGLREFAKSSADNIRAPSPSKSFEAISSSAGNVYYEKGVPDSKTSSENSFYELEAHNKIAEKNLLGSEPNICFKDTIGGHQFPSLSDLSFNFTSLAAQKILKGVSINSIDTLVELNMAATTNEKPNNRDVVHTDFGLV